MEKQKLIRFVELAIDYLEKRGDDESAEFLGIQIGSDVEVSFRYDLHRTVVIHFDLLTEEFEGENFIIDTGHSTQHERIRDNLLDLTSYGDREKLSL